MATFPCLPVTSITEFVCQVSCCEQTEELPNPSAKANVKTKLAELLDALNAEEG